MAIRRCEEVSLGFPPGEHHGKYIDLHSVYQMFLNMRRLRDHLTKSFVHARWAKYVTQGQADRFESDFASFREVESKNYRDPDYVTWLQTSHKFDTIPRHLKYKQVDYSVRSRRRQMLFFP